MQLMDLDKYTMQKPSFWRIAAAYVIEMCFPPLILLPSALVVGILSPFISSLGPVLLTGTAGMLLAAVLGAFSLSVYYVVLETFFGASVGKLICKIKVEPRSFKSLLLAYWLDMMLATGSFFATGALYAKSAPTDALGPGLLGFFMAGLVFTFNFIFIEGLTGASIGKWIFGVRLYHK